MHRPIRLCHSNKDWPTSCAPVFHTVVGVIGVERVGAGIQPSQGYSNTMHRPIRLCHSNKDWPTSCAPVFHTVVGVIGVERVGAGIEARARFPHELRPDHRGWVQRHARLRQQHKPLVPRVYQCGPQQNQLRLHLQGGRAFQTVRRSVGLRLPDSCTKH